MPPGEAPIGQAFGGKLVDSEFFISAGLSAFNKSIYLPGRVNMSLDEFFQSINIGMRREQMAWRHAKELERQGIAKFEDTFEDILSRNPNAPVQVTSLYQQLGKEEMEIAAKGTFAVSAGGKNPSYFNFIHDSIRYLKEHPVLSGPAKLMFPFYNTNVNLTKFAMERIPGGNLLIKETGVDMFGMRGPEKQAEALGKLFVGSAIMTTGWMLAESENMTGGYPPQPDPNKKTEEGASRIPKRRYLIDSDWQPYSMLMEDGYVSTAGLDPVSMMIQGGADMNMLYHIYQSEEVQRGLFKTDADYKSARDASSLFFFYLVDAAKTKIDLQPLSKGTSDIMAILDPRDPGFETAVANLLTNVNPQTAYYQTLRSQWARADDKYQRNSKAKDIIQKMHKNWRRKNTALFDPTGMGGSKSLNPRVNFMGDPMLHQIPMHLEGVDISRAMSFFNPFRTTPRDLNPVSIRIHELGGLKSEYPVRWASIDIPDPNGETPTDTKPHPLTDEQQYDLVMEATRLNRETLPRIVEGFGKGDTPNIQRELLETAIKFNKETARVTVQATAESWKEIARQWPLWEAARARSYALGGKTEEAYNTTGWKVGDTVTLTPEEQQELEQRSSRPAQLQQYIESQ